TEVDPRRPRVEGLDAVRACREIAVRSVDALEQDLARPLELGCVRMAGPLAVPEVEDACGVDPLLRRLASVPRGQRAVGLPRTSRQLEPARTIAPDRQQRDRGRLELRPL